MLNIDDKQVTINLQAWLTALDNAYVQLTIGDTGEAKRQIKTLHDILDSFNK
jgi:hypothetical protein